MIRLRNWLAHRHAIAVATLTALALTSPALAVGWQLDDIFHRVVLLELSTAFGTPATVFSSVTGDPSTNRELVEQGIFPWWTVDHLRLKFWLGLIRSRGHFPKGGYDVPDGATNQESAPTPAV